MEFWVDVLDYLLIWLVNFNVGCYYVENNWICCINISDIDVFCGMVFYESDFGVFGMYCVVGFYEYGMCDYYCVEDLEVFVGCLFVIEVEFDLNCIFCCYYIMLGEVVIICVLFW